MGSAIAPAGSGFIASSNSGTNMPGDAQPRSPPCAALVSSELARASCSKLRAPDSIWRLNSASRRSAASGVSSGEGLSRMCRTRDWSIVKFDDSLRSTSLTT